MELIILGIISLISLMISNFIFTMIILSLLFGIPETIKLKKYGAITKEARITPFVKTIILQTFILLVITLISKEILIPNYFTAIVWGDILGFLLSFKHLSKNNYYSNLLEVLRVQEKYIQPFITKDTNISNIIKPTIPIEKEILDTVTEKINEEKKLNFKSLEENASIEKYNKNFEDSGFIEDNKK